MKKTTLEIENNKKLIEKYPFLLPKNRWTDKVSISYSVYSKGKEEIFYIDLEDTIKKIKEGLLNDYENKA